MKYKFVDIGCSFFDTSVDQFGLDVDGLLVEPLGPSFKLLPHSNTVKKVNVGISDYTGIGKMFVPKDILLATKYISKEELKSIQGNELQNVGYSGCASLNGTHKHMNNLNVEQISLDCNIITFYDLCNQYNITEIDYLNIDTEGHEHIILKQVFDLVQKNLLTINHQLKFEYNYLSDTAILDNLCEQFKNYGFNYTLVKDGWNEDMVLTKL
jgi:hypothetical protein